MFTTRNFRHPAIFFMGLSVAAGLFQNLLYVYVGPDLITRPAFPAYFLTATLISCMATVFLLRSYYLQHYRIAFLTGLVAFGTALLRAMVLYCLLVPLSRAPEQYYPFFLKLELVAALAAAISLIWSRAGKNGWLKAAGILGVLIAVCALALLFWSFQMHNGRSTPTLERFQLFLSFFAGLQPLLFTGFFSQQSDGQEGTSGQSTLLEAARVISVAALFFTGVGLFGEAIKAIHPPKEAVRLAGVSDARIFINPRGDTLSYRLLKPINYDSTQRYPLLVSLHGGAGYGTDNIRQLASWEIQQLSEPENQKKYPAFILAPQCSRGTGWGGIPNLVARDTIVFELMSALEKEYSIDPDRRYVAGGSLGGYGTWYFIGTRPGVFAAAIPLCGAGDPALAQNMKEVAIWAFHGENDQNVPVEGSRRVIKAIRQAGGHPRYTEFPETGHYLTPGLEATPGILDWLFSQKRQAKDTPES